MPLIKSGSKQAISTNIREMQAAGHPHDQSVAAALSTARRYGKAAGGNIKQRPNMPWFKDSPNMMRPYINPDQTQGIVETPKVQEGIVPKRENQKLAGGGYLNMENMVLRNASRNLHSEGMINSAIPGRTDKLPMRVRAGSYILPADFISALGQNNSMAGGEIAKRMFNAGPYGMATMHGSAGVNHPRLNLTPPRPPKGMFADGGGADDGDNEHVPIIAAGAEYVIPPEVVRDLGHGNLNAGHKVLDALVLLTRKEHIKTLEKLPGPKGS